HQELAEPDTSEQLFCKGRSCAKCHKCHDWHFDGDQDTWNWICNYKNWNSKDWDRWDNDCVYEHFVKRNDATCRRSSPRPLRDSHLCRCQRH
ncbi:unnamed protein product, partial [Rotaria sp. Silwood2]